MSFSVSEILKKLEIDVNGVNPGISTGTSFLTGAGAALDSYSPADGKKIASIGTASSEEYEAVIKKAEAAYAEWRLVPAPKRGEVVRQLGDEFRKYKNELGALVSY